jgi:hypothetical protein
MDERMQRKSFNKPASQIFSLLKHKLSLKPDKVETFYNQRFQTAKIEKAQIENSLCMLLNKKKKALFFQMPDLKKPQP